MLLMWTTVNIIVEIPTDHICAHVEKDSGSIMIDTNVMVRSITIITT